MTLPSGLSLACLLAIAGTLVGSYLATIVMRWPEGRSATTGRSACDGCGSPLRWFELVPLLSAALSGLRCRRCGDRIDPVHSVTEALAAIIPSAAALLMPPATALAFAAMTWLLIPLFLLDWRHLWLPDRLTALLALVGFVGGHWLGLADTTDRLLGGFAGFLLLWTLMRLYRTFRGHDGLGAGDPKLFGAIGLWLGWAALPFVLLLAAVAGMAHFAMLAATGRAHRGTALPFGSCLAFAAIVVPLLA